MERVGDRQEKNGRILFDRSKHTVRRRRRRRVYKDFYYCHVLVFCSKISYYNSSIICILKLVLCGRIIVTSYCKKVWRTEKESEISVFSQSSLHEAASLPVTGSLYHRGFRSRASADNCDRLLHLMYSNSSSTVAVTFVKTNGIDKTAFKKIKALRQIRS
jgi:hypothetical protein